LLIKGVQGGCGQRALLQAEHLEVQDAAADEGEVARLACRLGDWRTEKIPSTFPLRPWSSLQAPSQVPSILSRSVCNCSAVALTSSASLPVVATITLPVVVVVTSVVETAVVGAFVAASVDDVAPGVVGAVVVADEGEVAEGASEQAARNAKPPINSRSVRLPNSSFSMPPPIHQLRRHRMRPPRRRVGLGRREGNRPVLSLFSAFCCETGRVRVLIIEDEVLMAASLKQGLEAEGYVVDVAHDGIDGLWRTTEFEFDAVLLDIMLPGINGFVVAQRLRELGRDVPILMLTAKNGELDQAEALDIGADDFLSKPFSYPVLLARLRALIRRGSSPQSALLVVGDLRIDVSTHECWRGEVRVELTPKEFALIEFLAHHAGVVVTKAELLRHVWDDERLDGNVVEVYIGYLRRKIDAPFGRSSIETVRGSGYRLVAQAD
jgi:two-component system, OmpR family, response regulator